jgi:hypothetical protein
MRRVICIMEKIIGTRLFIERQNWGKNGSSYRIFYKYSTSAREAWCREISSPWNSKVPFSPAWAGLCRSSDEEIVVETYMACSYGDSP